MRLSASDVVRCSLAVCERVLDLARYRDARDVVVYAAIGNEIDPMLIAERASAAGKAVYLPAGDPERFEFVARATADVLPETAADVLFLVPGVAFDERGARLGRGRAWYDRALARHPHGLRVGLAYDFQVVPVLPRARWDIGVHAVVTETRLVGGPPKETHP